MMAARIKEKIFMAPGISGERLKGARSLESDSYQGKLIKASSTALKKPGVIFGF